MNEPFVDRWKQKWLAAGRRDVGISVVPCGNDWLPDSAAPYLSFNEAARSAPLWEVYGVASQWSSMERQRLADYRMIGSDGAGNPICILQSTGAVVLLDHEDGFHSLQFINSSVQHLAECLLAYMNENDAERFRTTVLALDPAALVPQTFWWDAAVGLSDNP